MTKKKDPKDYEKIGRPTEMTPETIDKLEYAFALGCSDLEACYYADIGKSTLYNYQNEHPEFLERKNTLKERPVFKARNEVMRAINEGDTATARWFLERKVKQEFSAREELTGADGSPLAMPTLIFQPVRSNDPDKPTES